MKWDGKKIKECAQIKAKIGLKGAIKAACEAGIYYEDIAKVVADTLNEVDNERRKENPLK